MTIRLITAPVEEPVTLAEAKSQCKEDFTANDARIAAYIGAARETCEHILQRSVMQQTWEIVLDAFPCGLDIELPNPPVLSIVSVKYIAAVSGLEETLATNLYSLDKDSEPGWLMPARGTSWPATLDVANALRVRYQTGYENADSVPKSIKSWVLLAVEYMFNQFKDGVESPSLPRDFMGGLLDRHRLWRI